MIRKLEALGLALVAVFAMSAMAASAAQAAPELTASNTAKGNVHETAFLHAVQLAEPNQDKLSIVVGESKLTTACETSTSTGTLEGGTGSTVSLTPTYDNCKVLGSFVMHVTTNGCAYRLHVGSRLSADHYSTTTDIVCETGGSIVLTVTNLLQTKSICTMTINGQKGLESGEVVDTTEGSQTDVDLIGNFSGIVLTTHNEGGAGCAGIPDGQHVGTYTGTTTVTAKNAANEPLDLNAVGE